MSLRKVPVVDDPSALVDNDLLQYDSATDTINGVAASALTGADHGALAGLADDDHTQYLLADGSRTVGGDLLPDADDSWDLGSSSARWAEIHTDELDVGGAQTDVTAPLVVASASADPLASLYRVSTDVTGPRLGGYKARGTAGSPAVLSGSDEMLRISGYGYDSAAWRESGSIRLIANSAFASADAPGTWIFSTIEEGTSTPKGQWRLEAAGNWRPETDSDVDLGLTTRHIATGHFDDINTDGLTMGGDIVADVAGTHNIGATGTGFATVYTRYVQADTSQHLRLRGATGKNAILGADATDQWEVTSSQLRPLVDSSESIGTTSLRPSLIYADDIDTDGLTMGGDILPDTSDTHDLGSDSARFAQIYSHDYWARDAVGGIVRAQRDDTSILNGNNLGALYFGGTDTAGTWHDTTRIVGFANETWGVATNLGSYLRFDVTAAGGSSPTARWYIQNDGDFVPFTDSDVDIGATATRVANAYFDTVDVNGSVQFPASQVADADANALDDYEEGAWTPSLTFGGGSTGMTYTDQLGVYIKTGRLVTLIMRITLSAKGSSSGTANISGLPFTYETGNQYRGGGVSAYADNMSTTNSQPSFHPVSGGTSGALYDWGGTSNSTGLSEANFTDVSRIQMVISYYATD